MENPQLPAPEIVPAGAAPAAKATAERAVLEHAWRFFGMCDAGARQLQSSFRLFQRWILVLGLAGVILALGQKEMQLRFAERAAQNEQLKLAVAIWGSALRYPIILAPILVSLLLALSHRFRPGNRWVLLRTCAEAVRREIYAYRLGAGRYGAGQLDGNSALEVFRERIEALVRRLMQTEVNRHAVGEYTGHLPPKMYGAAGQDDGFSAMTPTAYVEVAIGDQLTYYAGRTAKLERELKLLVGLIVAAGAAGTFLAAIHLELWIALTTAMTTALTTHLKTWQIEETLVTYNQGAADLRNLRLWWDALPPENQRDPATVDRMVETAEKILDSESAGWAQRMSDVLADLRAAEAEAAKKAGGAAPVKPPKARRRRTK